MPVTLSIRDVPDDIAERLRARAKQNHRSLQGELMAIVEGAAETRGLREDQREYRAELSNKRQLTIEELSKRAKERAIYQPGNELSVDMIRRDRDEGHSLPKRPLDAIEALKLMRSLGVRTPGETGTQIIRRDRDEGH